MATKSAFFLAIISFSVHATESALNEWTPETSVAVRYFSQTVSRPASWPGPQDGSEIHYAPDGQRFFVISHKGDLKADAVDYRLDVFDVDAVRKALATGVKYRAPRYTVTFSSLTNEPGVRDVEWTSDSQALFMLGATKDLNMQLYRLDIHTGTLQQLTHQVRGVADFKVSGKNLVYSVAVASQPIERLRYPMAWVRRNGYGEVKDINYHPGREEQVHALLMSDSPRDVDLEMKIAGSDLAWAPVDISPDGRWVVVVSGHGNPVWMINLQSGDRSKLGHMEGLNPEFVKWFSDSRCVSVRGVAGPNTLQTFSLRNGIWVSTGLTNASKGVENDPGAEASGVPLMGGLVVQVRQGANEPPELIARMGKQEVLLSEPDPVLQEVWWARQESFSWKEANGDTIAGGLLLPRDYVKGQRLPLVIQAYVYFPTLFLPDGPHEGTKDCAQSLVSEGFAVLQLEAWTEKPKDGAPDNNLSATSREGPAFVEKIDAAVAALVSHGIVDPKRVGLTGFSRGGYMSYFAITHPRDIQLAAVVIDDSYLGDYSSYVIAGMRNSDRKFNYDGEFWENRAQWLELETSFNADRIRTPTLFTQHNSSGDDYFRYYYGNDVTATAGTYVLNTLPFDYVLFPDGEHHLKRPRERIALINLVVDWMNFWLQDRQPDSPELADRWGILRKQQLEVLKRPPLPRGRWQFIPENTHQG